MKLRIHYLLLRSLRVTLIIPVTLLCIAMICVVLVGNVARLLVVRLAEAVLSLPRCGSFNKFTKHHTTP